MPSCAIVVENLPVPFDRRVWQEAKALSDAGWTVSVICPKTEKYPLEYEVIDDIKIYRHPLPLEARGSFAFILEYAAALFHESRLLWKIFQRDGFDVIHACNPPDLIFLTALPFKLLGKQFVFDHHDVSPELFEAKFGRQSLMVRVLKAFEWLTFKTADLVISANDTFRDIAVSRGGKSPARVVTVYSIPDKARMRRTAPNLSIRNGKRFVIGYVGIIGDQDGVDHFVRMIAEIKKTRDDFRGVVVGDGPALASVRALASELELDNEIEFTGYLSGEELLAVLSAFDIGIIPDPMNPYNDKISMNKVFEYSALGLPIVAYDLKETRRLLMNAGVYAETSGPEGLAEACLKIMQDDNLRSATAARAKLLSQERFSWDREAQKLVDAYSTLTNECVTNPASG